MGVSECERLEVGCGLTYFEDKNILHACIGSRGEIMEDVLK